MTEMLTKPDRLGSLAADRYRSVSEARLIDMLLLGGFVFEVAAGDGARAAAEVRAAIERWIGLGLGCRRDGDGGRLFDPVEVVNLMTWAGLSGADPFWTERYVRTGRRLVADAAPGADRTRQVSARLSRRFHLRGFEPGAPVRLRMPVPLAGPRAEGLRIEPVTGAADVRIGDGRMEARLAAPRDQAVEIGAHAAFMARLDAGAGDRLEAAEAALYLRPAEGLIRVSPRVQALADALAGATRDPMAALRAFWAFMMDRLRGGMVQYDQAPADAACDWVLEHGWFDCQLGSALLVALCRARGVPARIVSGHVLYPLAPTNHFWTEAWIDGLGWAPFDLLSWTLSSGGRDPAWRDRFFGTADFRMVTQVLPLSFTGPMSVRLPASWQMVQSAQGDGIAVAFLGADGGLVLEDRVSVGAAAEARRVGFSPPTHVPITPGAA